MEQTLEQLQRDVAALHGRLSVLEQTQAPMPQAAPPKADPRLEQRLKKLEAAQAQKPVDRVTPLEKRVAALEARIEGHAAEMAELRDLTHAVQAELVRLAQATDTISGLDTRLRGLEAKAVK